MIAAALEASSYEPSVALCLDDATFEERLPPDRAHASGLLPALERLLSSHDVRSSALERLVVGTGPGSFTGLRVAVALALGLARSVDADLVGVPSLEAVAWSELEPGQTGAFVLDARAGELYFALYARSEHGVDVVERPRIARRDELAIPDGARVFADEGAARSLDPPATRTIVGARPRASAVLALGRERAVDRSGAVPEPLYLRPFAARPRRR